MEPVIFFERLLRETGLGTLVAPPQRVMGGLMHRMYRLDTAAKTYAVKLLNPAIMQRPDVMENLSRAERLEKLLEADRIPVVPALEIAGHKMHSIDGQFFYVFHWIDGKALRWDEIERTHCETIGTLLAQIHKVRQSQQSSAMREIHVDWDALIQMAAEGCADIVADMERHRDLLYVAQEAYNAALQKVPAITCICNGDMDSKNVLWVDGKPAIIDLECLDYGNPYWEAYRLALSWAGDVVCNVKFELLHGFLMAYCQEYGAVQVDWKALYGGGYGWLEWLEYNVKRALNLECVDEAERRLGINQVKDTLSLIAYYHSIKDDLLRHLDAVNADCSTL